MKCTTTADGRWVVIAEWYGQDRVVFGPTDVFAAAQWMRRNA